ncbi:MAG: FAD synthetase family protein [Treponema sp.]|nr:FAD synthetase family protein [Treponema sp.]
MKIFTWTDILESLNSGKEIKYFDKGTGISTGSFDGFHQGHRVLIKSMVEACKKNSLIPGVVSFLRPLPSLKHSDDYQGDLSTLNQRIKLLEELGVQFIIIVDFDDSFASMLGADYLNLLVNLCNMKLIAEGIDFRCGYKGATDSQAIRYFAEQNHIKSIFVDPIYYRQGTDEEERISSSYIRQMVSKGFFATVQELLERPFELDLSQADYDAATKAGEFTFSKNKLIQVLPPVGVYHCKDQNNDDVRVEINAGKVKLNSKAELLKF